VNNKQKSIEFALPRLNIAIYYLNDHLNEVANQLVQDRRFMNSKLNIHNGGISAAIKQYENMITPNLLIIEVEGDLNQIIGKLFSLSEVCDRETHVIIAGEHNDVELYRELLRYGIAEYLLLPTNATGLMSIISNLYKEHKAPLSPSVAFIGASGGVGTSILAQTTALTIACDYNIDTIFTDLDSSYAMSLLSWSLVPHKNLDTIIQHTQKAVDDSVLKSCLQKVVENLMLLNASLDPMQQWNENDFDKLTDCFTRIRSISDFSIIDIPSGQLTVEKRAAIMTSSEIVIVTEPTIKGIRNLGILYTAIQEMRPNDPPPKVLINKVDALGSIQLDNKVIIDNLGIDPDLYIQYVPEVIDLAIARGAAVSSVSGSTGFIDNIQNIVDLLLGNVVNTEQKNNIVEKFLYNFKKSVGI